MTEHLNLPYEDRDPEDGALFSTEWLYACQTAEFLAEYIFQARDVISAEKRSIRTLERLNRQRYVNVKFNDGNPLSDEQLVQERMIAADRIIRAIGAQGVAYSVWRLHSPDLAD